MNIDSAQKLVAGISTYIGRYAPGDKVPIEIYQPLLDELQVLRIRYNRYRFDVNLLGKNDESEVQAAANLLIEALAIIQSRLFLPVIMLRHIAESQVLHSRSERAGSSDRILEEGDPPAAILQMIPAELPHTEAEFKNIVPHLLQEVETVYSDADTAHAIGNYFFGEVD